MRPTALLALAILCLATPALAGAQGRVSIENLTIDGDPPPDEYREVLASGLRPSLESIRDCYGTSLRAHPAVQGDYALRMWVSNREVIRITPESHIGDTTLEECTRTAIYRFRLPPEAPTGGAWVRMTVRFVAPAVAPSTPPATPPTASAAPPSSPAPSSPAPSSPAPSSPAPSSTPPATTSPPAGGPAPAAGARVVPPTVPLPGTLSELMTALPGGASLPTVTIESVSGAMERGLFSGAIPVPTLAPCADGTAGSIPVRVSVDAAGHVSARAGRGMSSAVRRCVASALEALTLPGPTRARIRVTFVASAP